jgi:cysteinyl-tRNA synthetase
VGHLENDADEGEDKIAKKARLEELEPMEIVQFFTERYHENMRQLNVLSPSIEPRASGHIPEQIELVQKILDAGYAYISNGSVYFDLVKYSSEKPYGVLSGRVIEDLLSTTRELDGQDEKHNSADFALWKKASPEHIMRWKSPWSEGFPGWHLECSAMSCKYLGETFDIHGGGMDLLFPHHESEIAQSMAANNKQAVKYWMHNNMITINGQKMGKSLGNFITLNEFFSGTHKALAKAFSPMTIRFFILQAQYRSTLDFSNEALSAAEKGLKRLMDAYKTLEGLMPGNISTADVQPFRENAYKAMCDDFNSPMVIAEFFDAAKLINNVKDGRESLVAEDINHLKESFSIFLFDILGLQAEGKEESGKDMEEKLMGLFLELRQHARQSKDFTTSDHIRDGLKSIGIVIRDTREGSSWEKTDTQDK